MKWNEAENGANRYEIDFCSSSTSNKIDELKISNSYNHYEKIYLYIYIHLNIYLNIYIYLLR